MSQSGVETSDLQLTRSQSLPSLVIDKEPSVAISADYLDDVGSQTARHVASGSASGMIGSAAGIALTTKNQLWQIQRVASDIRQCVLTSAHVLTTDITNIILEEVKIDTVIFLEITDASIQLSQVFSDADIYD
eukprot:TRINITY_DN25770_c0_g2_i1.p2 TRINITY_DN25770_c0_g2~~TRINITY_DN25770_c0_g2_i1.p2  ORF type:complete len:133 (+),score=19.33 TRINITY_DN25770_c0_g2_i1:215-613(+)